MTRSGQPPSPITSHPSPNNSIGSAPALVQQPLSVFGVPIPPTSQVESKAKDIEKDEPTYERETWDYLQEVIFQLVESVDEANLKTTVAKLFAENIVRGKGFFAAACIKFQFHDVDKTWLYASLVGLVAIYFSPPVITLFLRLEYNVLRILDLDDQDHQVVESAHASVKFLASMSAFHVYPLSFAIHLLVTLLLGPTELAIEFALIFHKVLEEQNRQVIPVNLSGEELSKFKDHPMREAIRDMANRDLVKGFSEAQPIPKEFHWVCHEIDINCTWHYTDLYTYRIEAMMKPSSERISRDDFMHDKYFHQREKAYAAFRRISICEGHWMKDWGECRYFSYYQESSNNSQLLHFQLPHPEPDDKVQFCLEIFKYSHYELSGRGAECLIPLLKFLCSCDKGYTDALETCFFVMWLMIWKANLHLNVDFFTQLLHHQLLSWEVVAELLVDIGHLTVCESWLLQDLFEKGEEKAANVLTDLLKWVDADCLPGLLTFFEESRLPKSCYYLTGVMLEKAKQKREENKEKAEQKETVSKRTRRTRKKKRKQRATRG